MSCEKRASGLQRSAVSLLAAIVITLAGCGYGEISPTAYQYAKALYSLSNKQAADRVDKVEAQITAAAESGELPQHEADWLLDICTQCRDGQWQAAQTAARQMMQDQVR